MSAIKKKILEIKIEDIISFKTIIDTLSKIVPETSFIIHNPKEKNKFVGLEINTADPTRTVFIKIQIEKDIFSEFYCKTDKYQLGINLEKLTKTIKFIENDDILLFALYENDIQNLVIENQRANTKGKKTLKLALVEIEYEDKTIKKVDFEKVISMSPVVYKKIFRELDDYQNIKIKCSNKKIAFTYKDQTSEVNDEYILDEDGINISNTNTKNDFVGMYPIKFIVMFTKCSALCEEIQIYMKNEYALTILYPTISFGKIKLTLSPINEDTIKNVEYDYSDDEDELDVIGNNTNKLYYDDD
jgi:proliferating cell nuclear antigen